MLFSLDQSDESICVLGPNCVDIFGTDGSMFASPLPFKVSPIDLLFLSVSNIFIVFTENV